MNPYKGVRDVLGLMMSTSSLFKVLFNFSTPEFDKLCQLVCPTIVSNAQSTNVICILSRHPSKLSPKQQVFGFVLYMEHDPTTA